MAEKDFHTAEPIHEGNDNRNEDLNILGIDLPRGNLSDVALHELDRINEAKGNLIKKTIGANNLSYEITDKAIRLPWF